ncbi:MAG: glycoside hydrolase domain-containing protein [Terriglobales bacterium]
MRLLLGMFAYVGLLLALAIVASAQDKDKDVHYGVGTWDADSYGNHRAVVRVRGSGEAVWAHLPWRRRDQNPDAKEVMVVDAKTGHRVRNVVRVAVNREYGDFVFEPVSGLGDYYFYYLPYTGTIHSPYPKITYLTPKPTASLEWLTRNDLLHPETAQGNRNKFPAANVVEFQSVDEFNSFYPMEVIATSAETAHLLAQYPQAAYLVFPEDRRNAIRMTSDLPALWTQRGPGGPFRGEAARGEFYAFQLGVWAARAPLSNLQVKFGDLQSEGSGVTIPPDAFRCFNLGGVDWQGTRFTRAVSVAQRTVAPLWCGVQVPEEASAGLYRGELTVTAEGKSETPIAIELAVGPEKIRNSGDDDPWRLSRLRWLDSQLAADDELVPPYSPVEVHDNQIGILGRRVTLAATGIPSSIQSFFDIEMTHLAEAPREVLAAPITLLVEDAHGRVLPWVSDGVRFTKRAPGAAAWESHSHAGPVKMDLHAQMEFDGNIEFTLALDSTAAVKLNDLRLEIPLAADVARYAMGLGLKGGARPASFDWKWNIKRNQDSAWVGDVNAGLQFTLKDDHYARPLNTNFYQSQPLVMPVSWDNLGQGGCRFAEPDNKTNDTTYLVTCYSGPRTLVPGQTQHYNFRLLLTPFHTINTQAQWSTRFFHAFKPLDEVAATGANTINIHHATAINPYLNYPFLRPAEMKAYIDDAHQRGMRVKIYYTVRELTNHAPELFALKSLGSEVIAPGTGGGFSWLQEHLDGNYIAAWHVPELKDAAVINTGISRWHNFYVEGLRWLVENEGIDGLYLDDVAFDRTTMKRVRKVLTRGRPNPFIDLHSANQFDVNDGFASSANLYLEHFPFIDRLWFGEYFDYNSAPDYWLTEISGIPFGLMGEMLQDGGNPWRGMIFGMTNRMPWSGDPRPLWHLWDEFGMQQTRMIGFWVPSSPVRTGNPSVLATVYQADGRALVAVASWAKDPTEVKLSIDWKALGIDPADATITAPAIANFQDAASFRLEQPIPVQPGRGWLFWIVGHRRADAPHS